MCHFIYTCTQYVVDIANKELNMCMHFCYYQCRNQNQNRPPVLKSSVLNLSSDLIDKHESSVYTIN